MGNVSFTGLNEMFESPNQSLNESSLYADLPDTPQGPNEMLVSPLSEGKGRSRKSTNLVGVKELFTSKQSSTPVNLVGVKEMLKTPKAQASPDNLVGVKEMMNTPKATPKSNLVGVKEMMKTPRATPKSNLVGVKEMMKTPKPSTSANLVGVKEMLKTPKVPAAAASPSGVDTLFQSPQVFVLSFFPLKMFQVAFYFYCLTFACGKRAKLTISFHVCFKRIVLMYQNHFLNASSFESVTTLL